LTLQVLSPWLRLYALDVIDSFIEASNGARSVSALQQNVRNENQTPQSLVTR
jgi:hypothetical protein